MQGSVQAGSPPLSDEQERAVDGAHRGGPLAIVARAGSGKTHTLRAIAEREAGRRTHLLAFNRSVAADARARLPEGATASTVHALAYRSVVASDRRMRAKVERARHGTPMVERFAAVGLDPRDPNRHAHLAAIEHVLGGFLRSDAPVLGPEHLEPEFAASLEADLGRERFAERRAWLVRRAARLWQRMVDPEDAAPLSHDGYLKLFALQRRPLPADLLLIDEAQDLAPVTLGWLQAHAAQVVLVGDPAQRIYGWRGAVDAMAASGHPEVRLTRSFRFGDAIAACALRVLHVLAPGARLRGVGPPGHVLQGSTDVGDGDDDDRGDVPRAVLCRGNGGVLEAVLAHAEHGVHVVGGIGAVVDELESAYALWCERTAEARPVGRATPLVRGIDRWSALVHAADMRGGSLRTLVAWTERHGHDVPGRARALRAAVRDDPARAAVTVSTVHRAKGREWDDVELWSDLPRIPASADALRSAPDPERAREEANLLYVAVTRARRRVRLGRISGDLRTLLLPDGAAGSR